MEKNWECEFPVVKHLSWAICRFQKITILCGMHFYRHIFIIRRTIMFTPSIIIFVRGSLYGSIINFKTFYNPNRLLLLLLLCNFWNVSQGRAYNVIFDSLWCDYQLQVFERLLIWWWYKALHCMRTTSGLFNLVHHYLKVSLKIFNDFAFCNSQPYILVI